MKKMRSRKRSKRKRRSKSRKKRRSKSTSKSRTQFAPLTWSYSRAECFAAFV